MITIIDDDNLIAENGTELVSKDNDPLRMFDCQGCWLYHNTDNCVGVACSGFARADGKNVIFVEKNTNQEG